MSRNERENWTAYVDDVNDEDDDYDDEDDYDDDFQERYNNSHAPSGYTGCTYLSLLTHRFQLLSDVL